MTRYLKDIDILPTIYDEFMVINHAIIGDGLMLARFVGISGIDYFKSILYRYRDKPKCDAIYPTDRDIFKWDIIVDTFDLTIATIEDVRHTPAEDFFTRIDRDDSEGSSCTDAETEYARAKLQQALTIAKTLGIEVAMDASICSVHNRLKIKGPSNNTVTATATSPAKIINAKG